MEGLKMKRLLSIFAMILIVSVMFSFSCFAEETEDSKDFTCEASDGTRAYIHYTKTVVRSYNSLGSIPSSISYSEYNNTLNGWFSGTLYFKYAEIVGTNLYNATFQGEIYGNA